MLPWYCYECDFVVVVVVVVVAAAAVVVVVVVIPDGYTTMVEGLNVPSKGRGSYPSQFLGRTECVSAP